MALAHVTFACFYDYEIEVDDDLYDKDPEAADNEAIKKAYEKYRAYRMRPIADASYDRVEVEFE